MSQNTLKLLAQKAKKRLSTAGHEINSTEKTTKAYLSQKDYAIVASKQNIEEDPLFEKVQKLLDKEEESFSPLAELTDYKIFNNLSSNDKEKYIIELSKRYNRIREYLISRNEQ